MPKGAAERWSLAMQVQPAMKAQPAMPARSALTPKPQEKAAQHRTNQAASAGASRSRSQRAALGLAEAEQPPIRSSRVRRWRSTRRPWPTYWNPLRHRCENCYCARAASAPCDPADLRSGRPAKGAGEEQGAQRQEATVAMSAAASRRPKAVAEERRADEASHLARHSQPAARVAEEEAASAHGAADREAEAEPAE